MTDLETQFEQRKQALLALKLFHQDPNPERRVPLSEWQLAVLILLLGANQSESIEPVQKIWKPKLIRVSDIGTIVGAQSVSIGNEGAVNGFVTTSGIRTQVTSGGFSPTFTAPGDGLLEEIEYDATGTVFSIAILMP